MTDTPPDRLSNNPASPHFDAEILQRGIGVRFKGGERTNVEEYSLSEGWIRVQAGKTMDRKGQPLTIKLSGPVEVWFRDDADAETGADAEAGADSQAGAGTETRADDGAVA